MASRHYEETPPTGAYRIAEAVILLGGFALAVAKAWTASFSYDEALTFNAYATQSFHHIFTAYDANNHMVNTLGMKACLAVFGDSEFAQRLPALGGRVLFLLGAALLVRQVLRRPLTRLTCLLLLVIQPFLLDYGSIARGYGIGLGFAMMGLWAAIRLAKDEWPRRAWGEILFSVAWGLAIASVLVFANVYIPVLLALLASRYLGKRTSRLRKDASLVVFAGLRLGLPATLIVLSLYAGSIPNMKHGNFYVGQHTLWASIRSMTDAFIYRNLIGDFPNPGGPLGVLWRFALRPELAVVMLLAVFSGFFAYRCQAVRLVAIAFAGAIGVVLVQHFVFALPYPTDRTGIYFVPLAVLLAFAGAERLADWLGGRTAAMILALPAGLLLFIQAGIGNFTHFLMYFPTHGSRDAMAYLKEYIETRVDRQELAPESVRIVPSWCLKTTVNYYRRRLDMPYVEELDWPDPLVLEEGGAFYIIVTDFSVLPKETELSKLIYFPEYETSVHKGVGLGEASN